jgi:hypothetical protein
MFPEDYGFTDVPHGFNLFNYKGEGKKQNSSMLYLSSQSSIVQMEMKML